MQKYEAIENGIANNDIKALREAIGSICYTCRDFSDGEFDAVVREVESKGIKIKDEMLIGSATISSQKNTFSDEDFAKAVFELKKNFCDDRIKDVKLIGRKLYENKPVQKVASEPEIQNPSNTNVGKNPNHNSHQQEKNMIPVVIGVVAVIVVIIIIVSLVNK